jgi:thiamine pyrophosphate-dependent acetolactate synthase large subunit-like protein
MRRSAWATSTTTPSPAAHPLFAGPLGYNGSEGGMELIQMADVVLAWAPG